LTNGYPNKNKNKNNKNKNKNNKVKSKPLELRSRVKIKRNVFANQSLPSEVQQCLLKRTKYKFYLILTIFFQFCSKKDNFFEKNCLLKMGSTNFSPPPPLKKIWRPCMPCIIYNNFFSGLLTLRHPPTTLMILPRDTPTLIRASERQWSNKKHLPKYLPNQIPDQSPGRYLSPHHLNNYNNNNNMKMALTIFPLLTT
jgi:hypothetical protein